MAKINLGVTVHCLNKKCGYVGKAKTFAKSELLWHDLVCPYCGTTELDLNMLAQQPGYLFDRNNFLIVPLADR